MTGASPPPHYKKRIRARAATLGATGADVRARALAKACQSSLKTVLRARHAMRSEECGQQHSNRWPYRDGPSRIFYALVDLSYPVKLPNSYYHNWL